MIFHRLRYGLIAVLLFACIRMLGQDVVPTLPFFAPLDLSPSSAGAAKAPRINMLYRNQWPQEAGGFRETYFSYDQFVNKLHGGMGMYFKASRDTNGTKFYKTAVSANYSLIPGSGDARFVPGIEIGFVHGQLNRDEYFQSHELSPVYTGINYLDLGTGFTLYSHRYMISVSGQHLNWPYRTFIPAGTGRLSPRLVIAGTAFIPIGTRKFDYDMSVMMNYSRQGNNQVLTLGDMFYVKHVCFGIFYRNREAFVTALGMKFNRFRVIYTYDANVSPMHQKSGGAHEISLQLYPLGRAVKGVFPSMDLLGF